MKYCEYESQSQHKITTFIVIIKQFMTLAEPLVRASSAGPVDSFLGIKRGQSLMSVTIKPYLLNCS